MKKMFLFIFIVIVVISSGIFCYFNITKEENYDIYEVNSEVYLKDIVKDVNNDNKLDTSKLGKNTVKINKKEYTYIVKDTINPVINTDSIFMYAGDEIKLDISDNSNNYNIVISEKEKLDIAGTYTLLVTATDSSGNSISKEIEFIVSIKPQQIKKGVDGIKYYIEIDNKNNIVLIFEEYNGQYTKLIKTFVCSGGVSTPLGEFTTSSGYEWGTVDGGVYARYSTRIRNDILFHSVPYFTKAKNDLEYEEYNKLGTTASAGCIRLTTIDSKWIFDNVSDGTKVYIYEGEEIPSGVVKPTAPYINVTSENKGWDPTDPDEENPWN